MLKDLIKNIIQESIETKLIEELRKVDLLYINSDESPNLYLYKDILDKYGAKVLGVGISRAVYQINQEQVLKLEGRNIFHQNVNESNSEIRDTLAPFIPTIYAESETDNKNWIISEKCKILKNAIDKNAWLKSAGMSSKQITDLYSNYSGDDIIDKWVQSIIEHGNKYNLQIVDKIIKASSLIDANDIRSDNLGFGIDGRPVIIDYGLFL